MGCARLDPAPRADERTISPDDWWKIEKQPVFDRQGWGRLRHCCAEPGKTPSRMKTSHHEILTPAGYLAG
jgi:hypothetical protein